MSWTVDDLMVKKAVKNESSSNTQSEGAQQQLRRGSGARLLVFFGAVPRCGPSLSMPACHRSSRPGSKGKAMIAEVETFRSARDQKAVDPLRA